MRGDHWTDQSRGLSLMRGHRAWHARYENCQPSQGPRYQHRSGRKNRGADETTLRVAGVGVAAWGLCVDQSEIPKPFRGEVKVWALVVDGCKRSCPSQL